jgi:hypothetical protein
MRRWQLSWRTLVRRTRRGARFRTKCAAGNQESGQKRAPSFRHASSPYPRRARQMLGCCSNGCSCDRRTPHRWYSSRPCKPASSTSAPVSAKSFVRARSATRIARPSALPRSLDASRPGSLAPASRCSSRAGSRIPLHRGVAGNVAEHLRRYGYDEVLLKVDALSSTPNNAHQIRDARFWIACIRSGYDLHSRIARRCRSAACRPHSRPSRRD